MATENMPGSSPERDLAAEYIQVTKEQLERYRESKDPADTENNLGLRVQTAAESGATYKDLDTSPQEILELYGDEIKRMFDKNAYKDSK